ncbi:Coiled-coil domain-containing protein 170 [Aix galericulata]|nr:Coiled-coil domain-containing protein 170 [Aix galericulata]
MEPTKESYDHFLLDIPVTREQMNRYRAAAETAQSELAALSVKYDCAQSELLELRSRMVSKEASFQELKAEAERYKENNARQASLLLSLQTRVRDTEEESSMLATSKKQAELTAQAASKENCELKEKLHEQNAKLKKYEELLSQLSEFLDTDIREKEKPQEHLMSKVCEICKENLALKVQVAALQEAIDGHEMESKASRETIMRLVSEATKEQKKAAVYYQDMEKLSKDLDSARIARQSLEADIRNHQDKLTANQKAWEASKQELHTLKKSLSELDESLKSSKEEARTAQSSLSKLLPFSAVDQQPLAEKAILERIQEINCKEESKEIMVSQFETQIAKLTESLENQTRLYQEALERNRKAEKQSETFQDQLKNLEEEFLSIDMMQDGLKLEKQKYLIFLEQLNEKMKLDSVAADVGFDMNVNAILARVEQLVKLEGDAVIENKTMAYNLRRKLKTQKEKLESKELHMNLLRQKITQLEEEKQVRTALAVERDEANLTVRKLHKMIERLQKQLDLARETNTDLKAKLSETNELKIQTLEQNRTIEELNKSQGKLQRMKEKVEKQLNSVKSELHLKELKVTEDKEKAKNMLEAVSSEIKVLKTTLAELTRRERQLADFREVVSRMLGLDIASLALPDYEIITRLEGLIHCHQHHFITCKQEELAALGNLPLMQREKGKLEQEEGLATCLMTAAWLEFEFKAAICDDQECVTSPENPAASSSLEANLDCSRKQEADMEPKCASKVSADLLSAWSRNEKINGGHRGRRGNGLEELPEVWMLPGSAGQGGVGQRPRSREEAAQAGEVWEPCKCSSCCHHLQGANEPLDSVGNLLLGKLTQHGLTYLCPMTFTSLSTMTKIFFSISASGGDLLTLPSPLITQFDDIIIIGLKIIWFLSGRVSTPLHANGRRHGLLLKTQPQLEYQMAQYHQGYNNQIKKNPVDTMADNIFVICSLPFHETLDAANLKKALLSLMTLLIKTSLSALCSSSLSVHCSLIPSGKFLVPPADGRDHLEVSLEPAAISSITSATNMSSRKEFSVRFAVSFFAKTPLILEARGQNYAFPLAVFLETLQVINGKKLPVYSTTNHSGKFQPKLLQAAENMKRTASVSMQETFIHLDRFGIAAVFSQLPLCWVKSCTSMKLTFQNTNKSILQMSVSKLGAWKRTGMQRLQNERFPEENAFSIFIDALSLLAIPNEVDCQLLISLLTVKADMFLAHCH